LVKTADLNLEPGEQRSAVEDALVALIAARASAYGRAPTVEDRDVALLFLGLGVDEEIPAHQQQNLIASRRYWAPRASSDSAKARGMVARFPRDLIEAKPEEIRHRLAMGENPLDRG